MRCLLRPTRLFQQPLTASCSATKAVTVSLPRRCSFTRSIASQSTSGYGDADQTGDDPSNNPNLQGSRPRVDTEHPGREPVDEGKGTGSGGYAETGEKAGGKRDGTGGEGKSEPVAENKGKEDRSGSGLGGKTMSEMNDPTPNQEEKADVERHNKEMDQRYDHKTGPGNDEKVEKGFWSGELGSVN